MGDIVCYFKQTVSIFHTSLTLRSDITGVERWNVSVIILNSALHTNLGQASDILLPIGVSGFSISSTSPDVEIRKLYIISMMSTLNTRPTFHERQMEGPRAAKLSDSNRSSGFPYKMKRRSSVGLYDRFGCTQISCFTVLCGGKSDTYIPVWI